MESVTFPVFQAEKRSRFVHRYDGILAMWWMRILFLCHLTEIVLLRYKEILIVTRLACVNLPKLFLVVA